MKLLKRVYTHKDTTRVPEEFFEMPAPGWTLLEKITLLNEALTLEKICYENYEPVVFERNFYNEANQPIRVEEYSFPNKIPDCISTWNYNEQGKPLLELKEFCEGGKIGVRWKYDRQNRLVEEIHFTDEGDYKWSRFFYRNQTDEKAEREEVWENNEHIATVHVKMNDDKNDFFKWEEYYENHLDSRLSRVKRVYDPKRTENGVAEEIYND